jgi:hypothetical protein
MPNHCQNDLYIEGPAHEIEALLRFVFTDENPPSIAFDRIIPEPDDLRREDDHMTDAQHHWRCAHWGTKWDGYDVERRKVRGVDCVSFSTAWSPPEPVIIALHKRFPALTFHHEFFEGGCSFCGGYTLRARDEYSPEDWQPGTKTDEWSGAYHGHRGY